jgi:hypothetical protein
VSELLSLHGKSRRAAKQDRTGWLDIRLLNQRVCRLGFEFARIEEQCPCLFQVARFLSRVSLVGPFHRAPVGVSNINHRFTTLAMG